MSPDRSHITYIPYARKSSEDDERQVQSIQDQEEWFAKTVAERSLATTNLVAESRSAKEPYNRPGFDEVVRRIREGEAQGILVWKWDRISRNPVESGIIEWLLQTGAIQSILTSDREYLPQDNALLLSVEAGMANQYIRDLSKNVKRGLSSKLKKGWKPGRAPIGYRNTKILERGENYIEKDPERFDVIKEAWNLMLTGNWSVGQILQHLNTERGLRTPRTKRGGDTPLCLSGLYKIFSNIFYTGLFSYKGKLHQGAHPPMVTVDEFDKVQGILGRPNRARSKHHTYAYAGLLTCGACGSTISATHKTKQLKSTDRIATYDLYFCVSAKKKTGCAENRYLNEIRIDEQIETILTKIEIQKEVAEWAVQVLERDADAERELERQARESVEGAIQGLGKQITNLRSLRLRDLVEDDAFVEEQKRLTDERMKLKHRLENEREEATKVLELTKKALRFAGYAKEAFQRDELTVKKGILRSLGPNRRLVNQMLWIEAPKWIQVLEKYAGTVRSSLKECEPALWRSAEGREQIQRMLVPELCGLVQDVRTAIANLETNTEIVDVDHYTIDDQQR